jgi:hypothetical protein
VRAIEIQRVLENELYQVTKRRMDAAEKGEVAKL